MQQDGFGQTAILAGRTRYSPNSLGGGCPFTSRLRRRRLRTRASGDAPGPKVRERATPQPDYFSQATTFWRSMSPPEQDHIAAAFSFELGKVEVAHVRARMLQNLAEVDADLTDRVAARSAWRRRRRAQVVPTRRAVMSPALSQMPADATPPDGRVVAILAGDGVDADGVASMSPPARPLR